MTMVPGGRERYYKALFERLEAQVQVKSHHRCKPISDVPADHATALIMHVADQMPEHEPRMPTKWYLGAVIELIARPSKHRPRPGDAVLNDLVDAVETALDRQPSEQVPGNYEEQYTTLGGIVQRCWISDSVVLPSTGESSDLAIALVPVVMLVVGGKRK